MNFEYFHDIQHIHFDVHIMVQNKSELFSYITIDSFETMKYYKLNKYKHLSTIQIVYIKLFNVR